MSVPDLHIIGRLSTADSFRHAIIQNLQPLPGVLRGQNEQARPVVVCVFPTDLRISSDGFLRDPLAASRAARVELRAYLKEEVPRTVPDAQAATRLRDTLAEKHSSLTHLRGVFPEVAAALDYVWRGLERAYLAQMSIAERECATANQQRSAGKKMGPATMNWERALTVRTMTEEVQHVLWLLRDHEGPVEVRYELPSQEEFVNKMRAFATTARIAAAIRSGAEQEAYTQAGELVD